MNKLKSRAVVFLQIIFITMISLLVLAQTVPSFVVFASETESTDTYGDLTFTLPTQTTNKDNELVNINADTTYAVKVYLNRSLNGTDYNFAYGSYEDYDFIVTKKDGTVQNRAVRIAYVGWNDDLNKNEFSGVIDGLLPGDKVCICDIVLSEAGVTDSTYYKIEVKSSNTLEDVSAPIGWTPLTGDETSIPTITSKEVELEIFSQSTTDTLTITENKIIYLLSNFNVVSKKDIEATHIVGPIIAQERAYRTGDEFESDGNTSGTTDENYLIASDYSRGVSSYVGTLSAIDKHPFDSTFKLNYGFETQKEEDGILHVTNFIPPHFYTRATEFHNPTIKVGVSEEVIENELRSKIYLYRDNPITSFYSPNAEGRIKVLTDSAGNESDRKTRTLQNDNYIDFTNVWSAIEKVSSDLLKTGDFTPDATSKTISINAYGQEKIVLEAGKSYVLENTEMLTSVDIDFPEDENGTEIYDFFDHPYPGTTIISFKNSTINTTVINGKTVSRFPETLVNGKILDAKSGDGGEYGEVGNKIIWNLPNVETTEDGSNRLVFAKVGPNVAGHIVAPKTELWNYYQSGDTVTWGGGNLNGTAIVKDFHSGAMEMHMWAYSGLEEKGTSASLSVKKEYTNGNLENQSFDFILDKVAGESYEGLVNTFTFPYTATSTAKGNVYFPNLIFEVEDTKVYPLTYKFILKEVIPDPARADISYDNSEYLINIEVTKKEKEVGDVTYVTLENTYTVTKDSAGVDKAIVFTNEKIADTSRSYSFSKVSEKGTTLNNAEFLLTSTTILNSETSLEEPDWANGISYTSGFITQSDNTLTPTTKGLVTFQDLALDTIYFFKESKAPEGYDLCEGYWKLTVNSVGEIFVEVIGVDAPTIENHQLVNKIKERTVFDITLSKKSGMGEVLEGAVFLVERVMSLANPVVVEGGYKREFVSDVDGKVLIQDLPEHGVYRLKETTIPDGFTLPKGTKYWLLETSESETKLYAVNSENERTLMSDLVLINMPKFNLPVTGGKGYSNYELIGELFIFGGVCMLCIGIKHWVTDKRKRGD